MSIWNFFICVLLQSFDLDFIFMFISESDTMGEKSLDCPPPPPQSSTMAMTENQKVSPRSL